VKKVFTSNLTVNELLLTRQAGLEPLRQVMGSSIYHVGWQDRRLPTYDAVGEVEVVSRALNHARHLALQRLSEEARRAGARAVVGLHVNRRIYDAAADLIEFTAVGTAVRYRGGNPIGRPTLTTLSGQDFWTLTQAGYWPVGVVAASTMCYAATGWQKPGAGSWWRGRANREVRVFSDGLNRAAHIVVKALHDQAAHGGASGIVGMEIEREAEEKEEEETYMLFTVHAIGTAIVRSAKRVAVPPVSSTVSLTT